MAYGLTDGGARARSIAPADLGRQAVAPTRERQDEEARIEAALKPAIARRFYWQYDRNKLPPDRIAKNVLTEMGVPSGRIDRVFQIIKDNGEFVGIIQQGKTGPIVTLDVPTAAIDIGELEDGSERAGSGAELAGQPSGRSPAEDEGPPAPTLLSRRAQARDQKVFIAHGKNREILGQLKELLTFGKFTAVIAEEHETTSKPVPDKVLDDMRNCFAGIIHVASEQELLDGKGAVHHKINENVLIEIGAAMALYGRNVILLVQKDVHLPSNLQGLYRCNYEGEKLDYEATMKLLKAFNEFRQDGAGQ